jgi:hypothetical protein
MPVSGFSFNDIDTAFVSSVSQLPAIDETRLKPDTAWQQKGYIAGYVDILGFTETASINGENYSIGVPVVRGNAWVQESPQGVQDSFSYSINISNDTITAYATLAAVIIVTRITSDNNLFQTRIIRSNPMQSLNSSKKF